MGQLHDHAGIGPEQAVELRDRLAAHDVGVGMLEPPDRGLVVGVVGRRVSSSPTAPVDRNEE